MALPNCTAYWKLDGSSLDAVNGGTGTDTSVTYNAGNGKLVQGGGFNGTSSRIAVTNAAAYRPAGSFSIGAWVKSSDTTDFMNVFASWGNSDTTFAGIALIVSGGNARVTSAKNTGTVNNTDYANAVGSKNVSDGSFHLIVGTYDGTKLHIYTDGSEEGTGTSWANNPVYQASTNIRIGNQVDNGTEDNFFNGAIDEVGLWTRALTATEIKYLWAMGGGRQYPFNQNGMVTFFN